MEEPGSSAPKSPAISSALLVAEAMALRIMDEMRPGTQLTSEAEMATDFGVSRITVREALKILAGRGLVALSRGKRAVVTQPDGAMFGAFLKSLLKSDPKNLFDLLQVRRSLEIQSVMFAARHASRAGLAAIEGALDAMKAAAARQASDGDGEQAFHEADVRFHQAMALSGGNRVLTFLFEAMEPSLLEAFIVSHRGHRIAGHSLQSLYEEHDLIFRHVVARDERAAMEAMTVILDNAEGNLRAALSGAI